MFCHQICVDAVHCSSSCHCNSASCGAWTILPLTGIKLLHSEFFPILYHGFCSEYHSLFSPFQSCPASDHEPPHKRNPSSQIVYNLTGINTEDYLLATANDFIRNRWILSPVALHSIKLISKDNSFMSQVQNMVRWNIKEFMNRW